MMFVGVWNGLRAAFCMGVEYFDVEEGFGESVFPEAVGFDVETGIIFS